MVESLHCGVGPFIFLSELGSGSQATAYLARNTQDQKLYGVKVFKSQGDMETEIESMGRLVNENVIKLFHASIGELVRLKNETAIKPYIVLELG